MAIRRLRKSNSLNNLLIRLDLRNCMSKFSDLSQDILDELGVLDINWATPSDKLCAIKPYVDSSIFKPICCEFTIMYMLMYTLMHDGIVDVDEAEAHLYNWLTEQLISEAESSLPQSVDEDYLDEDENRYLVENISIFSNDIIEHCVTLELDSFDYYHTLLSNLSEKVYDKFLMCDAYCGQGSVSDGRLLINTVNVSKLTGKVLIKLTRR